MLHTHYLRKWTKTPWYTRVYHMHQRGYLKNEDLFGLARVYIDMNREEKKGYVNPNTLKHDENVKYNFLRKLMKKYPELNQININSEYHNEDDYIDQKQKELYKMSLKYENLLKKGYSENESFDIIMNKYKNNIDEKIKESYITDEIMGSNKIRSFMDIYQQRAEYESRQKVLRMQRDEKLLKFLKENENNFPEIKTSIKIINEKNENEELEENDFKNIDFETFKNKVNNLDKESQEFLERSKYLLDQYYSYFYTKDNLKNLDNKEILFSVTERPKKIKKKFKNLISKLKKLNIKLDSNGEVDYSECENKKIINDLKKNKWVKFILMQKDIDFGFEHKKNMKLENKNLKEEILKLGDIENINETDNSSNINLSSIENEIEFNLPNINDNNNDNFNNENTLDIENLIHNNNYRLDNENKLLESFDQRILRLKKLWEENRINNLDQNIDAQTKEELNNKFKSLQEHTRRLKILIDKLAIKNSKKLFFEEHKNINFDNEEIPFERIENYLKLNNDEKIKNSNDEKIYLEINNIIKRTEIYEDIVNPLENNSNNLLTEKDSFENILNKLKLEKMKRDTDNKNRQTMSNNAGNLNKIEKEDDMFAEEIENDLSSNKNEKDSFLDYLKSVVAVDDNKKAKIVEKKKKVTKREIRQMRKKLYK